MPTRRMPVQGYDGIRAGNRNYHQAHSASTTIIGVVVFSSARHISWPHHSMLNRKVHLLVGDISFLHPSFCMVVDKVAAWRVMGHRLTFS